MNQHHRLNIENMFDNFFKYLCYTQLIKILVVSLLFFMINYHSDDCNNMCYNTSDRLHVPVHVLVYMFVRFAQFSVPWANYLILVHLNNLFTQIQFTPRSLADRQIK